MEEIQMLINKINCLLLRALIIGNTSNKIVDSFESELDYLSFLNIIDNLLKFDSEFLLLRNYIDKLQLIIRLGSEKFISSEEIRKNRNKYIIDLNKLNCTVNKNDIIDRYLGGETVMRGYLPYNDQLLFNSMHNDYCVILKLQEALDGNNRLYEIENHQFLESSSFFMYMIPEFYQMFPESIEITKNEFNRISIEEPKIKRIIKPIKKNLARFK